MNEEALKKLAGASNAEELRRAIEGLCRPFGSVKDIRLLPDMHAEEYLCIVELDSPNLNALMIERLGGVYFGDGVAFIIPLKHARGKGLNSP